MKCISLLVSLFFAAAFSFAAVASVKSTDELLSIYTSNNINICRILEAQQNMNLELEHVKTIMNVDDFMRLKIDDPSLPEPIRNSVANVYRFSKELKEGAETLSLDRIKELQHNLSLGEQKKVMLHLDAQIKADCNSGIYNAWKKEKVGYWMHHTATSEGSGPIDFQYIEKEAKSGNGDAKYVLGSRLVRGLEIEQDCNEGISLLKEASSQGIAGASLALSKLYGNGMLCHIQDAGLASKYEALYSKQK